jgi:hypothetical protein
MLCSSTWKVPRNAQRSAELGSEFGNVSGYKPTAPSRSNNNEHMDPKTNSTFGIASNKMKYLSTHFKTRAGHIC